MINDWQLVQTNLHRLSKQKIEVAVLPVGAIEAHNRHLPEGQDFFHASYVAQQSCRLAWEKGGKVICLPAIPYGVDCNLMDFPLTIHVSQSSLDHLVQDVVHSLQRHGIRKVVIINGHGGNDFTPLIRQLQCDLDVHLFLCNWWTVGFDKYDEIFENHDDHAGEMETSIALTLYPELVESELAQNGTARSFRFEALRNGWVKTSRNFSHLNDHCGIGDPSKASAEKGRQYLDLVIRRISDFLEQLAKTPIDELFPLK